MPTIAIGSVVLSMAGCSALARAFRMSQTEDLHGRSSHGRHGISFFLVRRLRIAAINGSTKLPNPRRPSEMALMQAEK